MYNLLQQLLSIVGPTGQERPVADALREIVAPSVDEISTDVMGNLVCVKKGPEGAPRVMLSAHMDHIGLVVVDAEKEGFLRVQPVGGVNLNTVVARHVVFQNGVSGVVYSEPLKDGEARLARHLFIDVGAESREEALSMVAIGDAAVFANDCFRLGKHRVAAPAMDDRAACALLAETLRRLKDPAATIVAVFSTQEEVGLRGAKTAAWQAEPDEGIAVDVTLWGDTPETKLPAIRLGAGPAVKIADRASISNPEIVKKMLAAADKAGVTAQREVLPYGGTDAGAIQSTRGGVRVGTLSIPCRYVHSACEMIDLRDLEGGVKLLLAYLEK